MTVKETADEASAVRSGEIRTGGQAHFPVVGVGASAGGLEAFSELLRHLPADTGMAFVFVQHLDPTHPSALASLLGRTSAIPVHEARDGVPFCANCAYVIPPNSFLAVIDGVLRLTPRPVTRGAPMPIDHFFMSLAEQVGSRAIGIVLSGTGSDGATGLREVKARGGLTFAQDEQTSAYPGMPRAAAAGGAVDFVLPPEGIAHELARIAHAPDTLRGAVADESALVEDGASLRGVLALLRRATGTDFGYYKTPTLFRRLARRMLLLNVASLKAYVEHVGEHPGELAALHDDLLINVTSFFRDAEILDGLVEHVFPALIEGRSANDAIRIWVTGCSTGEEAYSIAIVLLEFLATANASFPIQILASDLSDSAIRRCRAGLYAADLPVSPERLARFFVKTERGYQVSKTIRDICVFAKHNLLTDPPFSQVDLVSCRNVLIYLRPEYQRRVFEIFHYALKPSGCLLLGRSESASGAAELFATLDKPTRLYRKKPAARGPVRLMRGPEAPFVAPQVASGGEPSRKLDDVVRRADSVLAHVTPPAVVIDDDAEIIHFRGDTKPYLAPPSGPPTTNLFRLARGPLQLELRAAIDAARRMSVTARRGPVLLSEDGRDRRVVVEATPLAARDGGRHFVVLFSDLGASGLTPGNGSELERTAAEHADAAEAQRQLRETRLDLEGAIHELESLNEEYRSAHEEALSVNEELQSSNEELETAKEELQSANEELTTVNDELQSRSAELTQLNNDLTNVLGHTHMPAILVVGSDLRLRRFTPRAIEVLGITATDIGRSISEVPLSGSMSNLCRLVVETMETMQPHEQDVQDRDGRWYALRVRPYRTHDAKIDGAVVMLVDVDDLRRALGDAQEAQHYADAIVSTVREPLVVLDESFNVLRTNRGFQETFGISQEQSTGCSLFDVGEHQWDLPPLRELLESVIPQRRSFENYEMTYDSPSTGARRLLLNARRIEDPAGRPSRILLAMEDVTERRRVETDREELLAVTEHARDEAQGIGDVLRQVQTITDMRLLKLPFDDLLQEILQRVQKTLGGDIAIILLRGLADANPDAEPDVLRARAAIGIDDETRAAVRVPIGQGFVGQIAATQDPMVVDDVDDDQVVTPYFRERGIRSLIGVPLLTEAGLLGVLHVGSVQPRSFGHADLEILTLAAERVAHAIEVAARRDGEHRARAAAEEANRAKDEFLALLSHELRNPLSAVRNAIVAARLDPAGRERSLEIASRQSAHLTRLVDDLLDVARITQGKIMLRREPIRLRDAAARAIETARASIEGRGHELSVECSSERSVDADPARLEQIIENLLTNAAKYTPTGGQIELACESSGDEEVLLVRDNGIGIARQMLPRVFDLFAQEDTRLDRTQGGLGIGLTVVRRLVELHGGRIEAHSDGPDRGSEFVVRLPALATTITARVASEAEQPVPSARILLVEDNLDAAESMQILLELSGHRVRVANDGAEALREVEIEVPDIALIDLGLPGISGYELAGLLRDRPGTANAALVALSGYGRDEDQARALQAGFQRHLTKPVDIERLQALIGELLSARRDR